MNILYDLTATQPSPSSKFHGGGLYGEVIFYRLMEYLDEPHFTGHNIRVIGYYDSSLYLNPCLKNEIEEHKIRLYDIKKTPVREIVRLEGIDRFYSALLNLNQDIPLGEIRVFTTVHGLRTLEMPSDSVMKKYALSLKEKIKFSLISGLLKKWYFKKLLKINGRLVKDPRIEFFTISNHSQASIKSFYPELREKNIPVLMSPTFNQLEKHPELISDCASLHSIEAAYCIKEKKYFLLTSASRWIKNAWRGVKALDTLFSDGFYPDFKVVVTGVKHDKVFLKGLENPCRFVFLEYIERNVLEALNKYAFSFVYPSLNEGFGYPPLDAMKYGVPVLASGTSSIPEICGDAAIYFNPESVQEIRNRALQLLNPEIWTRCSKLELTQFKTISESQKAGLDKLMEYLLK